MIKHIVFWKVSPPGDSATHRQVYEEFAQKTAHLQSIIPEILVANIGLNYNEGDVFNICIDSLFKSRDDLDAYINQPDHLKVREWLNSVTYDKAVFDFDDYPAASQMDRLPREGKLIKHIVFWKVKPAGDKEAHRRVAEDFRRRTDHLKAIIPEIVDARIGYNYNDGDVFNICIDSLFRTREDLEAYIRHPDHLVVREWLNSVTYDKAVFDYIY